MFILIKNTNFGYNSFLVDSIYVSNTIEEAREKAFKIIKEQYIEDCMEECGYIEGNEEPEIVNYEDNDDESKAQIYYDYEEAYTIKTCSRVFVTISKPKSD